MSTTLPTMGQSDAANETSPTLLGSTLARLFSSAGSVPLETVGWIRVTGDDRVRWLNGMVTNSIQTLKPGEGCYNFVLSAQGRIQGDCTAFLLDDCILLQTARDRVATLVALLDRFIIMDDVVTEEVGRERTGIVLAGPEAFGLLQRLDLLAEPVPPLSLRSFRFQGEEGWLIHGYSPVVPRYELWSDHKTIAGLAETLFHAGAAQVSAEAFDQLRILEGTPLYGTDIRDRELPQETATVSTPSRALHFSKGCYLGQEIVERIRSRGNVHRTLSGFVLDGALPKAGASLFSEDDPAKPLGELTSVAAVALPSGLLQIALGYIRREALDRNLLLHYEGGSATASMLPFAAAKALVASPSSAASGQPRSPEESSHA